jgi:hypothetical protein
VIGDEVGSEGVPSQRPFTRPVAHNGTFLGPIHSNPFPNTDSPGQVPECAAGNERYSGAGPRIGNPPGNVGLKTETTTRAAQ